MNDNTKRLLIILGIAAIFCLVAVGAAIGGAGLVANYFKNSIVTEREKVQEMANTFVTYELPAGYSEQTGIDLMIYRMVVIGPEGAVGSKPVIVLVQFEAQGMSVDEMAEQVREAFEQQVGSAGTDLEVVESRAITIDGTETTLTVSEGTDPGGDTIRQWLTAFPGKVGYVLVMVQGEVDGWDDAALDAFLASLGT